MADDDFNENEQPDEEEFETGDWLDDQAEEADRQAEEDAQATRSKLVEAQRRAEANELRKLRTSVATRFLPFLSFREKALLRRGRKRNSALVRTVETALEINKKAFAAKLKILGIIVLIVLGVALLIFAAVGIAAAIDSLFSWLNGGTGSGGGATSQSPIMSGDNYYGVRTVYRDDEKARNKLIEDYSSLVEDAILSAEESLTDYSLDITIEFPSVDYDYSTFDETTFASDYTDLSAILGLTGSEGIIDIVYSYDEVDGTASTTNERLDAIKYFGLSADMNEEVGRLIINYINANDLYTTGGDESGSDSSSQVESEIENRITEYFSSASAVRVEKVFIRDYIFEADGGITNLVEEEYICAIYMPKSSVSVNRFEMVVGGEISLDDMTVTITDGTNSADLVGEIIDQDLDAYMFSVNNINLTADAFTGIDANNINYLSNGKSIYEILLDETVDNSLYIENKVGDDGEEYYSFKADGGIRLDFGGGYTFAFADNDLTSQY